MSQKKVRRLLTAGALAILLANGPAWAGTREAGRAQGVWQWLAHIWQTALSALWSGSSTQNSGGGTVDQGYGVDPNG
jgi:hypothetical protein